MNAVSLRREGGIYFVPASDRDSLIRLRQLITDIPKDSDHDPFVCALGVPDAVEAKRSLSKAVHAGLLDEISSLQTDLSACSRIRCEPESSVWNEKRSTFLQRRTCLSAPRFPNHLYHSLLKQHPQRIDSKR